MCVVWENLAFQNKFGDYFEFMFLHYKSFGSGVHNSFYLCVHIPKVYCVSKTYIRC